MEQLSAEDRQQLLHQLKTEEFRRDISEGIESADRGELKPAKEVLDRLRRRAQSRL